MNENQQLIVLTTDEEVESLLAQGLAAEFVSFDTETTGVDKESEIIGFSFSDDVNQGYYVVLLAWDNAKQVLSRKVNHEIAKKLIYHLASKKLVMHNALFDCWMVQNNFGIDLRPSVHTDTMILGHLLDENRSNGLKELGVSIYGESAKAEQEEMKASVTANGGKMDKNAYELYKADSHLIAKYGAKDAILTLRLFYEFLPKLFEEGLDKFFYEEECMPLFLGPTYDLNTVGLTVDAKKLKTLQLQLEADCMEAEAFIHKEVERHIKDKYPGTNPKKTFNINSNEQRAWLLFEKLGCDFHILTKAGRELCKAMEWPIPYNRQAKIAFKKLCKAHVGQEYRPAAGGVKKVKEPLKYYACGKETLALYAKKYRWVAKYLEYAKNKKLLTTYVCGIQDKIKYNVIRPAFLQHGTTSGRYSSRKPNFQNLPRDDKRVKECIISRPGRVFVGADYSQLEPRVFASLSGDKRLIECFKNGEDFYSVIGAEVFDKHDCAPTKDDFGEKYPKERAISKVVGLSATYGTTAFKMSGAIGKSTDEAQQVIDDYFHRFPDVRKMMLESHKQVMSTGVVYNLFGRPRRIPRAMAIPRLYPRKSHEDLPYEWRNLLNLSVNHRIQSTGASIMNRAAIKFDRLCKELAADDPRWKDVKVVLQVHDELVAEGPEAIAQDIATVLKFAMERTVSLPGVDLIAEPKIGHNLAELK